MSQVANMACNMLLTLADRRPVALADYNEYDEYVGQRAALAFQHIEFVYTRYQKFHVFRKAIRAQLAAFWPGNCHVAGRSVSYRELREDITTKVANLILSNPAAHVVIDRTATSKDVDLVHVHNGTRSGLFNTADAAVEIGEVTLQSPGLFD
jgi:hypothetical protein